MVKEREWRHWMPFYNGSTERLGENSRCDCHRTFARPVGSKTVENRYFWTPTAAGGRGLNLSFIQVLEHGSILGHWKPTGPLVEDQHRRIHNEFAPRWRMNWQQVMREIVGKLQPPPTVLVLNMGLWSGPPNATYAAALDQAARAVAPRVVWKTTTRMRKSGPTKWLRTDLVPRRVFGEIFDAARLTRQLVDRDYWDPRHFQPHVYNHLNAAVLRQLYGPPTQCEEFSHGRCGRAGPPKPASAPEEVERAALVAEATRAEGWAGTHARTPGEWSVLQTMMWLDSLGIEFDAKEVASRALNGSELLALVHSTRLSEVGVSVSAQRRTLIPALERRRSVQRVIL